MSKTIRLISLSAVAALGIGLLGGCAGVDEKEYNRVKDDLQTCRSELDGVRADLNRCEQKSYRK